MNPVNHSPSSPGAPLAAPLPIDAAAAVLAGPTSDLPAGPLTAQEAQRRISQGEYGDGIYEIFVQDAPKNPVAFVRVILEPLKQAGLLSASVSTHLLQRQLQSLGVRMVEQLQRGLGKVQPRYHSDPVEALLSVVQSVRASFNRTAEGSEGRANLLLLDWFNRLDLPNADLERVAAALKRLVQHRIPVNEPLLTLLEKTATHSQDLVNVLIALRPVNPAAEGEMHHQRQFTQAQTDALYAVFMRSPALSPARIQDIGLWMTEENLEIKWMRACHLMLGTQANLPALPIGTAPQHVMALSQGQGFEPYKKMANNLWVVNDVQFQVGREAPQWPFSLKRLALAKPRSLSDITDSLSALVPPAHQERVRRAYQYMLDRRLLNRQTLDSPWMTLPLLKPEIAEAAVKWFEMASKSQDLHGLYRDYIAMLNAPDASLRLYGVLYPYYLSSTEAVALGLPGDPKQTFAQCMLAAQSSRIRWIAWRTEEPWQHMDLAARGEVALMGKKIDQFFNTYERIAHQGKLTQEDRSRIWQFIGAQRQEDADASPTVVLESLRLLSIRCEALQTLMEHRENMPRGDLGFSVFDPLVLSALSQAGLRAIRLAEGFKMLEHHEFRGLLEQNRMPEVLAAFHEKKWHYYAEFIPDFQLASAEESGLESTQKAYAHTILQSAMDWDNQRMVMELQLQILTLSQLEKNMLGSESPTRDQVTSTDRVLPPLPVELQAAMTRFMAQEESSDRRTTGIRGAGQAARARYIRAQQFQDTLRHRLQHIAGGSSPEIVHPVAPPPTPSLLGRISNDLTHSLFPGWRADAAHPQRGTGAPLPQTPESRHLTRSRFPRRI